MFTRYLKTVMVTIGMTAFLAVYAGAQDNPDTLRTGTLQWYASRAKAEGKTSIEITQFPGLWEQIGLEAALERYTVLRAIPIASFVQPETDTILTWYKFKIVGVLSRATKCKPCDPSPSVPPALLPLQQNEIAVPIHGGTATVDGVAITVSGERPKIEMNEQYLLFLRGTASSNQVGLLGGGSQEWAFKIDKEGKLHASSGRVLGLSKDLLSAGKIDTVREHINSIKARQPSPVVPE